MLRILLGLTLPCLPLAAESPPVSVAAAEVAPAADFSLLPLTLPGYELRVLDQRKTLTYDAAGTRVDVRLPIFFYLPNSETSRALRLLRRAVDDLRRAAHQPDRNEYDFEKLLNRFEDALAALGQHEAQPPTP